MKTEDEDGGFVELEANSVAKGVGRKATDEELIEYLSKDGGEPIDIDKKN